MKRKVIRPREKIENLSLEVQALYWSVPRLWPDSTVFIIGGGPSIKKQDLTMISANGHKTIGCNAAFLDYPWIDCVYFGDCKFHMWITEDNHYKRQFDEFKGLKISCCPDTTTDKRIHSLFRIQKGIVQDRRSIGWNMNTGGSAINLGYHLGASRIILLGFDMHLKNGMNYHDYHIIPPNNPEEVLKKFIRFFRFITEDAKELKLKILNATPESALNYFPMVKYEEVVNGRR